MYIVGTLPGWRGGAQAIVINFITVQREGGQKRQKLACVLCTWPLCQIHFDSVDKIEGEDRVF